MSVAIIGAGIGGLSAALALLKAGVDVHIYEQAAEMREIGAGIQIAPNGNCVLASLGVLQELKTLACESAGKEIRLWNSGQTWKLFDLGTVALERYGYPYLTVYRPDLISVLTDAVKRAKPDVIRLNKKCIALRQDTKEVVLGFEDGSSATASVAIGADGVHSRVRQILFGEDRAQFTGIIAWRGTVPMDKLAAHMRRMIGTNWIGPGGHVVHYPVRRGEAMNFVGVIERSDWKIESWTTLGDAAECAGDFKGWHDDVHRLIQGAPQLYKWALVGRPSMDRWTEGRVSLLGDACHATLPFLAQGAAMAMEDGVVLARALQVNADPHAGLKQYEQTRRERTGRVVAGSAENTKRFHNPRLAEASGAQEYVDREWSEARIKERYEWLFTYDATRAGLA